MLGGGGLGEGGGVVEDLLELVVGEGEEAGELCDGHGGRMSGKMVDEGELV